MKHPQQLSSACLRLYLPGLPSACLTCLPGSRAGDGEQQRAHWPQAEQQDGRGGGEVHREHGKREGLWISLCNALCDALKNALCNALCNAQKCSM